MQCGRRYGLKLFGGSSYLFAEDIGMDGFRLEWPSTAKISLPPSKAVFPWLSLELLDSRIEVDAVFQDGI